MTHVRFPDFSAPAPVHRPRAVAITQPAPSPAVVAAVRALDRPGEILTAILIIAGGTALVGFAPLL